MRAPMALGLCPAAGKGGVFDECSEKPGLLFSNNRRKDHNLAWIEHPSQVDSSLYCGEGTAGVRRSCGRAAAQTGLSEWDGEGARMGYTRADMVSVCERPAAQGMSGTAPASHHTGPVSLKSTGNKERHQNPLIKEEKHTVNTRTDNVHAHQQVKNAN